MFTSMWLRAMSYDYYNGKTNQRTLDIYKSGIGFTVVDNEILASISCYKKGSIRPLTRLNLSRRNDNLNPSTSSTELIWLVLLVHNKQLLPTYVFLDHETGVIHIYADYMDA